MSSPVNRLCRRSTLTPHRPSERWMTACTGVDLTSYQIKEYLAQYPNILREYLIESAPIEFLEEILEKKKSGNNAKHFTLHQRPTSVKLSTKYSDFAIEDWAKGILSCTTDDEIRKKIYDICEVVALTIDAFSLNMYIVNDNGIDIVLYQPDSEPKYKVVGPIGKRLTVSAHVATEKKTINVVDLPQDARFPKGV